MWEVLTGRPAFGGLHHGEIIERVVLQQERPSIPANTHAGYAALMCACWAQDYFSRPSMEAVLKGIDLLLDNPQPCDDVLAQCANNHACPPQYAAPTAAAEACNEHARCMTAGSRYIMDL